MIIIGSDQISRSVVSDSLQSHESQHARPPCPSPTPGIHWDSRPLSQWCHPAISSSVIPFSSCPQSLPASVFPNESALHMRWPKYWSFSFSIISSKEIPGLISFRMDWLDLLAVQGALKSLLQHHSSKASILLRSAFFTVQLSHPFLLLGTPFLVFWLESHGFSFPDVLCTAHNRVCYWDLVVRDQGEKSNRDSSHTLDSMVSLLREKGFLSLSFSHLFCYCCLRVTVGLNRGWAKRGNEKPEDFLQSFWPIRGHSYSLLGQEREDFWSTFHLLWYILVDFRLSLNSAWEKLGFRKLPPV